MDWDARVGGAASLYNYHKTGKLSGSTKRFTTTTASGLEATVARRDELEPRDAMAKRMRERRTANHATSIVFGTDASRWETDAMSRQRDILKAGGRDAEQARANREMKEALTRTNFELGSAPTVYERSMRLQAPGPDLRQYTGVLNEQVQRFIKKSSLSFGTDSAPLESTARRGMAEAAASFRDGAAGAAARAECRRLKEQLQRNSFQFGDPGAPTDFTTDHRRDYVDHTGKSGPRAALASAVMEDLRRAHFTLGTEEAEWDTDSRRQMRTVQECAGEARDPAEDRRRNFAIKQSLQLTHLELGRSAEYM